MTHTLSTYLTFPGNAAEVFEHWAQVFEGDLNLTKYGDVPTGEFPFEPDPDLVAHAQLIITGGTLTGGDSMPGEAGLPLRDTAYSLLYSLNTPEEAREVIQRLVDGGGHVGMPFEEAPWGGYYGQVFDRFGVMWAFDVEAPDTPVADTEI